MDSGRPFYGLHADAYDLLITDGVGRRTPDRLFVVAS